MSVEIRGLRIVIGGTPIIGGVDLSIADGERVGLIGASGSGKSMIAKSLLGLLPHEAVPSGEITMGDASVLSGEDGGADGLAHTPTSMSSPTCEAGMWARYSRIRPMRSIR